MRMINFNKFQVGIVIVKNTFFVLLINLVMFSCVDKYWAEVDRYDHVLVVDGMMTNNNESIEVRLSYSSPINTGDFIPATEARMYILINDIEEITLDETEPGIYRVRDSLFVGKFNYTYQLFIDLPDGKHYSSDTSILRESSPIDSIYAVREKNIAAYGAKPVRGIQFYLDNHSTTCDTCYYFWKSSQTYKFKATFNLDYLWVGEYVPFPNPDSLRTCYHTTQIGDLFLLSTQYFDEPIIEGYALNFVSTETKTLSIRYSLGVSQLSLSKKAFNFFSAIKQQNIEQGNLYSKQPIQIKGNVKNIEDPDEPVLGYFVVAGETKKRIFLDRPNMPFYYVECERDRESMLYIEYFHPSYYPIYLTGEDINSAAMAPTNNCFDCRLDGGSLTPPDFWIDK